MEPESSLPYSQAPATCPYPEPTPSSTHNPFPRPILILSFHLRLSLPNGLFPSGFPTKTLCTPQEQSIPFKNLSQRRRRPGRDSNSAAMQQKFLATNISK